MANVGGTAANYPPPPPSHLYVGGVAAANPAAFTPGTAGYNAAVAQVGGVGGIGRGAALGLAPRVPRFSTYPFLPAVSGIFQHFYPGIEFFLDFCNKESRIKFFQSISGK